MHSIMTIRRCEQADRADVARIWFESWNSTGLHIDARPSRRDYERRLAGDGEAWDIYVADEAGHIRGFIAFDRGARWLRQLFVAPGHQRKGIGSRLLDTAKTEMATGFWLRADATNVHAQRFYEKAGLVAGDPSRHPIHGHEVVAYVWQTSG